MPPEKRAQKLETAARTIAESRPRHRGVLLVEADPDLQWSLASNLPGMSGIEVARQLRDWNPDLLVILMDEEAPGPIAKERSSYVTAYLAKPFRFEALRALIESLQLTPAPAE
ncbi:MAG: hypothetical protein JRH14_19080 [Deltaproteobacteria bacterium]|nr:hypothetical protein [Deltaproteobacteria bacterium]